MKTDPFSPLFSLVRATKIAPFVTPYPIRISIFLETTNRNIGRLAYFWLGEGRYITNCTMKKIIIHSQNSDFGALIRGLLADIEAQFTITTSRAELIRACRASLCNLVLTDDARMFMNGSDTMEQIRHGNFLPQVFIFSHDLSEGSVTALLEVGVNQFMALPIMVERLRKKVNSIE